MNRLLPVVVALSLCGCGSLLGPDCKNMQKVTGDVQWKAQGLEWRKQQPENPLSIHSPVQVSVWVSAVKGCVDSDSLKLDLDVIGPDGVSETLQTAVERVGGDANHDATSTTAQFTPELPGAYEVKLHVEPTGEDQVRQLEVFDTATMPKLLVTINNEDCSYVGITNHGAIVCDSKVLRDDQQVDTVTANTIVEGDDVWSLGGSVTLLRDNGSGALMPFGFPFAAAPTEHVEDLAVVSNDLLVLTKKSLIRYGYGSFGGTYEKARVDFTADFGPTTLAYLGNTVAAAAAPADGPLQVCTFSLVDAEGIQRSAKPCQQFASSLLGGGDGRIWIGRSGTVQVTPGSWSTGVTSVTGLRLSGDHVDEERTMELPETFVAGGSDRASPLVRSETLGTVFAPRGDLGPFLRQILVPVISRAVGPYVLAHQSGVKVTYVYERVRYEGTPN